MANSIAIFTDTAHLATGLIGFGLSIITLSVVIEAVDRIRNPSTEVDPNRFEANMVLSTLNILSFGLFRFKLN